MIKNEQVEMLYAGTHIRIGKSKKTGNIYFQPISEDVGKLWFRFDENYYKDYKYYLRDFDNFEKAVEENNIPTSNNNNYLDTSDYPILDQLTLDYYVNTYRPVSIFINHECVYSDDEDVYYSLSNFIEDMKLFKTLNYYPFIEEVNIRVVDTHHYELEFTINIDHRG